MTDNKCLHINRPALLIGRRGGTLPYPVILLGQLVLDQSLGPPEEPGADLPGQGPDGPPGGGHGPLGGAVPLAPFYRITVPVLKVSQAAQTSRYGPNKVQYKDKYTLTEDTAAHTEYTLVFFSCYLVQFCMKHANYI